MIKKPFLITINFVSCGKDHHIDDMNSFFLSFVFIFHSRAVGISNSNNATLINQFWIVFKLFWHLSFFVQNLLAVKYSLESAQTKMDSRIPSDSVGVKKTFWNVPIRFEWNFFRGSRSSLRELLTSCRGRNDPLNSMSFSELANDRYTCSSETFSMWCLFVFLSYLIKEFSY